MIELIPILEITNNGLDLDYPKMGSASEYPNEWYTYNQLSNRVAGFPDQMEPYLRGNTFYLLNDVSDANLLHLIKRELKERDEILAEYPDNDDPTVCVLQGGYLLRVNGKDILFPQCCCDLADIESWNNLAIGTWNSLYAGHPSPIISADGERLNLDLTRGDSGETFFPKPPVEDISLDRGDLLKAVQKTFAELKVFAQRIERMAKEAGIETENLARLLIYDFHLEGDF